MNECVICGSRERSFYLRAHSTVVGAPADLYRCLACKTVFSAASLTEAGAKNFYAIKHRSSNYASYSRFRDLKIKDFASRLRSLETVLGSGPKRLLDLGCGEGQALEAAANMGWSADGVEIAHEAIHKAKAKGLKSVHCSPLEKLDDLKLGQYDVVTLFDVLDHVREPVRVLRAAHGHLRSGGILYLDVCNIDSRYKKIMGRSYTHIIPFEHLTYFGPNTLRSALERAGFTHISIRQSFKRVSLAFLLMTFESFNPGLASLLRTVMVVIPKRAHTWSIPIPVGIIAATASKT